MPIGVFRPLPFKVGLFQFGSESSIKCLGLGLHLGVGPEMGMGMEMECEHVHTGLLLMITPT